MIYVKFTGTDCDHVSWVQFDLFHNREEADLGIQSKYDWADGPMGHTELSEIEWQTAKQQAIIDHVFSKYNRSHRHGVLT